MNRNQITLLSTDVAPAALPAMQRVVAGIDPAAKASETDDRTSETGIVVAGLSEEGRGYVLAVLRPALPIAWTRLCGRTRSCSRA